MPPVVTGVVQQQRRIEESSVATVSTPAAPAQLLAILTPEARAAALRSMGMIEIRPGIFRAPEELEQAGQVPAQAAGEAPATYNPPPRPDYAPPYMASPIRPGYEGMPAVPHYGGKLIVPQLILLLINI